MRSWPGVIHGARAATTAGVLAIVAPAFAVAMVPWRLSLLASAMVVACVICAPATAQAGSSADAVYSNLGTFQNQSFAAGGATQQVFNTITRMVADDLNLVGTPPYAVNGFRFTVTNLNAVDVTARPLVRFYLPDGPGGGPGTLIEAREYNPTVFTAGRVGTIKTSSQFVLPSSHIWAGVVFDNNGGTTGATAAQLNNLAQGIFSPPELGTSTDQYFVTTAAGSFASNNPVGTLTNFGGAPPANFGWEILTAQDVNLSITKSAGAATAVPGGSVVYTITASNTGLGVNPVFDARVVDTFPASLACSWTCAGSAGNTCAASGVGDINDATVGLAAQGSVTYTVTCAVSPDATGTLVNTAYILAPATAVERSIANNSATTDVTVIAPPTIAKAFAPLAILAPAGTATLTVTLTNPDAATALTGVGFTDTLPAGLVVTTPNGLSNTCGGAPTAVAGSSSVSLTGGTLPAGSSCTITVSVTGATGGLKGNTTGAVTSTESGPGGTASAFVVVVAAPAVAPPTIAKAFGAASLVVNGTTTLTVTLTNANGTTLNGVGFTDTLPAGLVVTTPNGLVNTCGGTATAVAGSSSVSLTGVTLAAGGSCTVVVNVTGTTAGAKNNTTSVVTSTQGGTGGTASASLTVVGPPTIAKAFTPLFILATTGTTTLTFTLTNPNAATALTGVGFTDTLPAGLVVATPNGVANTCGGTVTAVAGTNSIALVNGSLAGGSCTIAVSVTGTTAGLKTNITSAVTSTEGGPGGTAQAFLVVVAAPTPAPPTIAKAFGVPSIVVNGTTTLTVTLANPNPVATLSGVGFADTLPAGLVVATPNGLANTCGGTVTAVAGTNSIALVNGGLADGASCTIKVNVTGATAGAKNNTTSTVTSTEGGTGGTASASLAVIAPPTIAKAFGAASVVVNGTTTLTVTLANPNPGTVLGGVGFTDPLPAGLVVATPNGLANTCGGTVTAVAGAGSFGLANVVLAAGGSCTITVNVTGTTAGAKNNTTGGVASIQGGPGGTASASLTVVAPPTIAKVFAPLAILATTGTTTLTFTLTNPNAGTALTGVGFTDPLPAGLVVATPNGLSNTCGGAVTAVAGSTSVSLTGGTLLASGSCTVTVSVNGTTGGLKNNTTGTVTSTEGGPGGTAGAFLVVVTAPTPAPPTIAKVFAAASVVVNGTTTLTVTLANPNPVATLSGVGFTDPLPAGLVVATPNGLANTCGGTVTAVAGSSSVSLTGVTLLAGVSCTVKVNVTGTTTGTKNNTTGAVASSAGLGGTASASLAVVGPPTLTKAFGAASVGLIQTTTLTFTVTNPVGNGGALTGMAFTDTLPAGLQVTTPNGLSGACGGGTITATAGGTSVSLAGATLAAGNSCVFAINVRAVGGGVQNNTTSAVTSTNGGAGAAATASITVTGPDPRIDKSHVGNFVRGQTGQYTLTVRNPGLNPTAGPVTVTDTLPAGLTATALSGPGWTCTLAILTCTRSDALAGGASYPPITLTVSVALTAPSSVTNTATVSGGNSPIDHTVTDPTSVAATPIPTLSTLAQVIFALLVLLSGLLLLHRRPTTRKR